jgi:hypothetical protein
MSIQRQWVYCRVHSWVPFKYFPKKSVKKWWNGAQDPIFGFLSGLQSPDFEVRKKSMSMRVLVFQRERARWASASYCCYEWERERERERGVFKTAICTLCFCMSEQRDACSWDVIVVACWLCLNYISWLNFFFFFEIYYNNIFLIFKNYF